MLYGAPRERRAFLQARTVGRERGTDFQGSRRLERLGCCGVLLSTLEFQLLVPMCFMQVHMPASVCLSP